MDSDDDSKKPVKPTPPGQSPEKRARHNMLTSSEIKALRENLKASVEEVRKLREQRESKKCESGSDIS